MYIYREGNCFVCSHICKLLETIIFMLSNKEIFYLSNVDNKIQRPNREGYTP